jgi:hypothetical protein
MFLMSLKRSANGTGFPLGQFNLNSYVLHGYFGQIAQMLLSSTILKNRFCKAVLKCFAVNMKRAAEPGPPSAAAAAENKRTKLILPKGVSMDSPAIRAALEKLMASNPGANVVRVVKVRVFGPVHLGEIRLHSTFFFQALLINDVVQSELPYKPPTSNLIETL